MYILNNKRAVVTGAAQGIGKEIVARLLKSGCKVCISDINESKGIETKKTFQIEFGLEDDSLCFFKSDVTFKEDWPRLWDFAEETLQGKIDILINNAGLTPFVSSNSFLQISWWFLIFIISDVLGRLGGMCSSHACWSIARTLFCHRQKFENSNISK